MMQAAYHGLDAALVPLPNVYVACSQTKVLMKIQSITITRVLLCCPLLLPLPFQSAGGNATGAFLQHTLPTAMPGLHLIGSLSAGGAPPALVRPEGRVSLIMECATKLCGGYTRDCSIYLFHS